MSRFYLVMASPGFVPSGSAFDASNAQTFERLADAILAGQAQSDLRRVPWIFSEKLVFTPDRVRSIYKKMLSEAGKELRDPDGRERASPQTVAGNPFSSLLPLATTKVSLQQTADAIYGREMDNSSIEHESNLVVTAMILLSMIALAAMTAWPIHHQVSAAQPQLRDVR